MKITSVKKLRGEVFPAADKSISHRAIIFGSIAKGTTLIENFLMGEDCLSTVRCFENMGVNIKIKERNVIVESKGMRGLIKPEKVLYTGNSGTTTRLLCGLLSPQNFSSVIDGDASIGKRPMNRVIEPLSLMGADIKGKAGGFAPIAVHGKALRGIRYRTPVASAQLKSALILAGIYAQGQTVIEEPEASRNHTELMLNGFGGKLKVCDKKVTVNPIDELFAREVIVPADISSAAFFLVAGLIVPNSELCIRNVGLNETRTGILDVLMSMGADITIENKNDDLEPTGDIVVKSSSLHGTEIGGALIPRLIDEIPVLAVAAAFAEGRTVIKDAAELKVKESNRIDAMAKELKKAGAEVTATQDGLIIFGGSPLHGAEFETYGDHRIAMALAVLALAADGESSILDEECIRISYPGFFDVVKSICD